MKASYLIVGAVIVSAFWYYHRLHTLDEALATTTDKVLRNKIQDIAGQPSKDVITKALDYQKAKQEHDQIVATLGNYQLATEYLPPNCPFYQHNSATHFEFDYSSCISRPVGMVNLIGAKTSRYDYIKIRVRFYRGNFLDRNAWVTVGCGSCYIQAVKDGFSEANRNPDGTWTIRHQTLLENLPDNANIASVDVIS